MSKSMADKQYDAAYKVAGEHAEEQLWIYYTVSDQWTRLVNMSDSYDATVSFMELFEKKGFDVEGYPDGVTFWVRKRSLIKVGA